MTANLATAREVRVAALAHRIWEDEGRPEGRAEHHWLRAAVLVDAEPAGLADARQTKAPAKKTPARKTRKA